MKVLSAEQSQISLIGAFNKTISECIIRYRASLFSTADAVMHAVDHYDDRWHTIDINLDITVMT